MRCADVHRALDAYLDEELTPLEISRVQEHLDDCKGCRTAVARDTWLHQALAADAMTDAAPQALCRQILDRVRVEAGVTGATHGAWPRPGRGRSLVATAAALLLAAITLAVVLWRPGGPTASQFVPLHRELVEPAAPMADVSLDLRGWLAHHLGAPVSVPSLTADGERISGGRAIVVGRRPAVQLLYEGRGRRLSLFILRGTLNRERGESEHTVEQVDVYTSEKDGSRIGWWSDGDHVFVAVGAVERSDLLEFAQLCIHSRRPEATGRPRPPALPRHRTLTVLAAAGAH